MKKFPFLFLLVFIVITFILILPRTINYNDVFKEKVSSVEDIEFLSIQKRETGKEAVTIYMTSGEFIMDFYYPKGGIILRKANDQANYHKYNILIQNKNENKSYFIWVNYGVIKHLNGKVYFDDSNTIYHMIEALDWDNID